jgi:hypothetical protein
VRRVALTLARARHKVGNAKLSVRGQERENLMIQQASTMRIVRQAALAIPRRLSWRGHSSRVILTLTILACCAVLSAPASASCNHPPNPKLPVALPELHWLKTQTLMQQLPPSATEDTGASIVGLWHVRFLSGGLLYDEGFDQWHSDGSEILNDNGVPPAQGNVCLGVWKEVGPRTFKLKHPAWNWDANGNLIGTLIIHETVTLDADGDSYQGTFTFDFYDLKGNLTSEVKGDLNAKRITVD